VRDGGRVVIAPADWIHRDVAAASAAPRDWTARRATLSRRIAAVRRDAAAWAAAPTRPGGGEARAALDAILAEAEFRGAGHETWRTSVGRHIREWIDAKLQALAGRRLAWEFVGRLLAWAAALGALVTLAVAAWRLQWSRTVPLSLESAPPRLTSHEWAARARTAIAAGDRREAVRCAYHAALFRLEELGAWRVDPTRTPREYLSLLPREDARRGIVGDLTRDFERAWYGGDTPDTHGLAAQLEGLGCHASSDRAI
jgi:hypothetical protein